MIIIILNFILTLIGRIYCSSTTAALIRLKLKITNNSNVSIIPLEMERSYTIYVGGKKLY